MDESINSQELKDSKKEVLEIPDLETKIDHIASIPKFNSSFSIVPPSEMLHSNPSSKNSLHSNSASHSDYSNPHSQPQSANYSVNSTSNPNSAPNSNSNSNSNSNTHTSANLERHTTGAMKKKHSFGSFNNSANVTSFRAEAQPGIRNSMMSDYSGVVQHVDIDTIKFVGNKESLQLSQIHGISSSENSLVSDNYINDKNLSPIDPDLPLETKNSTSDSLEIPARSLRRPTLSNLDGDSMIKVIKTKNHISPNKRTLSSPPPKSPLPKLNANIPTSTSSSPLRGKHSRNTSGTSDASLKLHGRLDDIMKEVENLKLEFKDEEITPVEKRKVANTATTYSMSSTINSAYTSNSFHTANSGSIHSQSSEKKNLFEDFMEEPTENLNIGTTTMDMDPSIPTIKGESAPSPSKSSEKDNPVQQSEEFKEKLENPKTQQKRLSSHSHHSRHQKSTNANRSKRKSTSGKNKIRPFSYETLAKLLNATDGIIIGQEFATLNIPAEEKFLIERIVDSISRLTANMMLNPARYEQSCARLEHVLNVLEGFD